MKDPWEWEEADVQSLITNSVQESLTLEYKRCDALQKLDGKKKEISKDVSAFANSAGGVIVYGMDEDKHVPTTIDAGYDPRDISKEWLEQVINSTIERRIDGIRIKEVTLSGTKAGKAIYVVHIPQSRSAPHMATDNRYYKRFNFETIAMEDYEVRDVARRLETPNLFIGFRWTEPPVMREKPSLEVEMFVGNNSPAAAEFALLTWCVDTRLKGNVAHDNVITYKSSKIPIVSHIMEWRGHNRLPIWETSLYQLDNFTYQFPNDGTFCIFWEAQAPRMERKTGALILTAFGPVLNPREEAVAWNYHKQPYRKL